VEGQQQSDLAPSSFDAQSWYSQLFEYGLLPPLSSEAAAAAAVVPGDDTDSNLVPQLVESLVLPLALNLVAK